MNTKRRNRSISDLAVLQAIYDLNNLDKPYTQSDIAIAANIGLRTITDVVRRLLDERVIIELDGRYIWVSIYEDYNHDLYIIGIKGLMVHRCLSQEFLTPKKIAAYSRERSKRKREL